jgi:hypothetical protein
MVAQAAVDVDSLAQDQLLLLQQVLVFQVKAIVAVQDLLLLVILIIVQALVVEEKAKQAEVLLTEMQGQVELEHLTSHPGALLLA